MDRMHITPREDRIVRDPVTRDPLPKEGALKPVTTYWRRRAADGDVTIAKPPRAAKSEKKES